MKVVEKHDLETGKIYKVVSFSFLKQKYEEYHRIKKQLKFYEVAEEHNFTIGTTPKPNSSAVPKEYLTAVIPEDELNTLATIWKSKKEEIEKLFDEYNLTLD